MPTITMEVEEYELYKEKEKELEEAKQEIQALKTQRDELVTNVENKVVTYTTDVSITALTKIEKEIRKWMFPTHIPNSIYDSRSYIDMYSDTEDTKRLQVLQYIEENSDMITKLFNKYVYITGGCKKENVTIDTLDNVKESLKKEITETVYKEQTQTIKDLRKENLEIHEQNNSNLEKLVSTTEKLNQKIKDANLAWDIARERRDEIENNNVKFEKHKQEINHILQYKKEITVLFEKGYNFFNATKKLKQIKKIFNL